MAAAVFLFLLGPLYILLFLFGLELLGYLHSQRWCKQVGELETDETRHDDFTTSFFNILYTDLLKMKLDIQTHICYPVFKSDTERTALPLQKETRLIISSTNHQLDPRRAVNRGDTKGEQR